MLKRILIALVAAALIATVPTSAASAGPPEQVVAEDYLALFLDESEGTSIWVNTTASAFCTWVFGGFMGPPPVVDDALPAKLIFTPNGVVGSLKNDEVYVEVWQLDNPDGPYVGPCVDILDQLLAGTGPWATGTTSVNTRTNNLGLGGPPPEGPRAESGKWSGTADIVTEEGDQYRYKINAHGNDCGDRRCDVFNSTLRMV